MERVKLFFDEELHRYTDNLGTDYTSTTQIIDKYSPKFKTKEIAKRCVDAGRRGNPKYAGKTVAQLMSEWEETTRKACEKGTVKHSFLDDSVKQANNYKRVGESNYIKGRIYTIQDILEPHNFGNLDLDFFSMIGLKDKYPTIYNTIKIFVDGGYSIYTEIGVFSLNYWVSGLVDLVAIKDNTFVVIDWKTNKAPINYKAGYYKKDYKGDMINEFINQLEFMHSPISHLENSSGNKYALQLSTYTYLIEQFGFINKGIVLCHIREYNSAFDDFDNNGEVITIMPIPYLKDDVYNMLVDNSKHRENIQTKIQLWQ